MTNIKKMYLLLKDNPNMTNPELRAALGWDDQLIRATKYRLKMYGYINYGDGEPLTILRDYKDDSDKFPTSRQCVYEEMIAIYLEDFREQENFTKRLLVGKEIRLLMEAL